MNDENLQNGIETEKGAARPSDPYVGVRPFERHERDIFFGRDQDARFLAQ